MIILEKYKNKAKIVYKNQYKRKFRDKFRYNIRDKSNDKDNNKHHDYLEYDTRDLVFNKIILIKVSYNINCYIGYLQYK